MRPDPLLHRHRVRPPGRRGAWRWATHLSLLAALALLAGLATRSAWGQQAEADLKAKVLFQLMLFVQWPHGQEGDAGTSLNFCVLDDTPLARAMQAFEGRKVNDRVFSWRRVAAEQLSSCHAAYVGRAGVAALEHRPSGRSILWIGDELGLIERGAMLNLQVEGSKVVFDIGLDTLRRSGLDISAKVMRLARYVKET